MKSGQLALFPKLKPQFGGALLKGARKSKRPLTTKLPIHLILKSERAKAHLSFVAHQKKIISLLQETAQKYNMRIYGKAVNFNHVHIVILLPNLQSYSPWIRELTSRIVAYLQTKTSQNLAQFFELRPFTRIVGWGKDFKGVCLIKSQTRWKYWA